MVLLTLLIPTCNVYIVFIKGIIFKYGVTQEAEHATVFIIVTLRDTVCVYMINLLEIFSDGLSTLRVTLNCVLIMLLIRDCAKCRLCKNSCICAPTIFVCFHTYPIRIER